MLSLNQSRGGRETESSEKSAPSSRGGSLTRLDGPELRRDSYDPPSRTGSEYYRTLDDEIPSTPLDQLLQVDFNQNATCWRFGALFLSLFLSFLVFLLLNQRLGFPGGKGGTVAISASSGQFSRCLALIHCCQSTLFEARFGHFRRSTSFKTATVKDSNDFCLNGVQTCQRIIMMS